MKRERSEKAFKTRERKRRAWLRSQGFLFPAGNQTRGDEWEFACFKKKILKYGH